MGIDDQAKDLLGKAQEKIGEKLDSESLQAKGHDNQAEAAEGRADDKAAAAAEEAREAHDR